MSDHEVLRRLLVQVLQKLSASARQAALGRPSAKDGVKAFHWLSFSRQFVAQAEILQGGHSSHEFGQPQRVNHAVDLPASVTQANVHDIADGVRVGFALQGGEYLLVIGAWHCPVNQLGFHLEKPPAKALSSRVAVAAKYAHRKLEARKQQLREMSV